MASPVAISQADFALNLLRNASGPGEAAILSPVSVTLVLAVACLGAKGNTRTQINNALASGIGEKEFHDYLKYLVKTALRSSDGYTLSTASRLYVDKRLNLLESYVFSVEADFTDQLKTADFSQADALAKEINGWVEEQTKSKIRDLLSAGDVDGAHFTIINAIYFKGEWAEKFDPAETKLEPFFSAEGTQHEVQMMHADEKVRYFEDSDVQVLGLPYKSEEVFMFFLLPIERFGLAKLEKSLSGQRLLDLVRRSTKSTSEIRVNIPKFKLENRLGLAEALSKLGVVDAFSSSADFSGISETSLSILEVIQKAFIEVTEEGSEAAAATSLIQDSAGEVPPTFTADHPFLFAIVKNDTLLFIGRYV